MSEWRLPKLTRNSNVIEQSKYSAEHIEKVAGILTCLSVEAKRNDLTSMAFVLMELADGLSECSTDFGTLIRLVERMKNKDE
jgi:hypothetical protein